LSEVVADSADCVILVVDDHPGIRDLLRMILGLQGIAIEMAANGQEALALLSTIKRPCMILLDLMMPVMNGWEFYSALQGNPSFQGIPVVVMSAYSKEEIDIPPLEVLSKPLDMPYLRSLTEKYCASISGQAT
jgi:CheY-like chemotaxis protein